MSRDAATLENMQAQFGLHPLVVEDARHGHQRPKIEDYGDSLFAILHVVEPEGDELRVGEVAIFAGRNYVLTVRSHAERGFQEVRARCEREPAVCTGLREYFRDIYDHLQRLNQTIESIRDSVATAISVNLSMITLQENETMKRLAAYAALIAVPTMIAGIYGMNFEHMPELGWKYGYAVALGVMTVIDVYLFYRLRKSKWL